MDSEQRFVRCWPRKTAGAGPRNPGPASDPYRPAHRGAQALFALRWSL